MDKLYPDSEVELNPWLARNYDGLLNIATLGIYPFFIRKTIAMMDIAKQDKILDLGAGTGRNALLMRKYLSEEGQITALDIGPEMIEQFKDKTRQYPNMEIRNQRIDKPLEYEQEFDKVFISFVLHGFPHQVRQRIIENAYRALKPGGTFFILDYNEFDLDSKPFIIRYPFKLLECPYAFDYIAKDWKEILSKTGFQSFNENLFLFKYVRLLGATR